MTDRSYRLGPSPYADMQKAVEALARAKMKERDEFLYLHFSEQVPEFVMFLLDTRPRLGAWIIRRVLGVVVHNLHFHGTGIEAYIIFKRGKPIAGKLFLSLLHFT